MARRREDDDPEDDGIDDPAPDGHNPTFGMEAADADAALTSNDKVATPDGRGIILDVHENEFTFKGDTHEPDDGKLFTVRTEAGADIYTRDEISASRWTKNNLEAGGEDVDADTDD